MSANSNTHVRTGIIAAAGSASRMWPASKVFPKELFPLGRSPVLAHVIAEMVEAGIERIAIVARKDNEAAIKALLDPSTRPPVSVQDDDVVRHFERTIRGARFTVIEQSGPYGNGTPLLNGIPLANGEPCVYAFADDVILGENASAGLIRTFQRVGHAVLASQPVADEETRKFGILECTERDGVNFLTRFIEKPGPGETPSRLASLGRYLVTREVVEILQNTPLGREGELWLSDVFVHMLRNGLPVAVYPLTKGTWHTVGTPEGFARAVLAASTHPASA